MTTGHAVASWCIIQIRNLGENFSLKNFYLFEIGAVRPQSIVRIVSVAFPITIRRDEEFAEFFKDCMQSLSRPTIQCPKFAETKGSLPEGAEILV